MPLERYLVKEISLAFLQLAYLSHKQKLCNKTGTKLYQPT